MLIEPNSVLVNKIGIKHVTTKTKFFKDPEMDLWAFTCFYYYNRGVFPRYFHIFVSNGP